MCIATWSRFIPIDRPSRPLSFTRDISDEMLYKHLCSNKRNLLSKEILVYVVKLVISFKSLPFNHLAVLFHSPEELIHKGSAWSICDSYI